MNFKDQLTYSILKRFSVFTRRLSENRREKLAKRLASFIYYLLPEYIINNTVKDECIYKQKISSRNINHQVNKTLLEEGHAYEYFGGKKKTFKKKKK